MLLTELKKQTKKGVVDFIETKFRENRETMLDVHRSWMINLAWYRGRQNTDYNVTHRQYTMPVVSRQNNWRVRLVSNIMLPLVRHIVAKLTYIHPQWDSIPATPEEEDLQISQTATKCLINVWQKVGMNSKLIRLAFWQSICGNTFLKDGWDAEYGPSYGNAKTTDLSEETIKELMNFYGMMQVPEEVEVQQGDIFTEVIPPFNMTVDEVDVFEDAMWCIESYIKPKDHIVDKYGTRFKNLDESSSMELFLNPFSAGDATIKRRNGVLCHELWIKPGNIFKDGLHTVVGGNGEIIVAPKKFPYNHGQLPYSHFLEIYDPSSLYGTCASEQIRPNQARYNRISSAMMEQINLMSNLQWLVPRQAGLKDLNNRPGGLIHFNAPFEPKQTDLKPIPAYVERTMDRTRADIQDTASTHEVTEGKIEPGVRSGRLALALQDADDSVLGPTLLWWDEQLAKTGCRIIQNVHQFQSDERTIAITGEFNELVTLSFTGQELKGKSEGDYWKVRVKTYGRQAMSRSGREQLAKTLLELQVLNPLVDKDLIINILGAADTITIFDKNMAVRTKQWNELKQMRAGQAVPVVLGQEHLIHIEVCKKFINSSYWDKTDENAKNLIVEHLLLHIQNQVQEQAYPQIYAQQFTASVLGVPNGGQTAGPARSGASNGSASRPARVGR